MKALSAVFFALGIGSAAYFLLITGYAGISTSYCGIWLLFAAGFILFSIFLRRRRRHEGELPAFLPIFIYTSICLFMLIFICIMILVMHAAISAGDRENDYCVTLGARVYSDGVSRTLLYRLDRAEEEFKDNPDVVLVLSGGQENGDPVPEAFAMYNYLSMHGVPQRQMLIRAKETSTYRIMQDAALAIEADIDRKSKPKGPSDKVLPKDFKPRTGIITSDYNIFRAARLAEAAGIEDVAGIPVRSDTVLFLHNCVRESLAIVKDFLAGNFAAGH